MSVQLAARLHGRVPSQPDRARQPEVHLPGLRRRLEAAGPVRRGVHRARLYLREPVSHYSAGMMMRLAFALRWRSSSIAS
jgi:hypothetical protein